MTRNDDIYTVTAEVSDGSGQVLRTETYRARHLVLGIGADHDANTGDYVLRFRNTALDEDFDRRSGSVVSAVGCKPQATDFLAPLGEGIRLDGKGRLVALPREVSDVPDRMPTGRASRCVLSGTNG